MKNTILLLLTTIFTLTSLCAQNIQIQVKDTINQSITELKSYATWTEVFEDSLMKGKEFDVMIKNEEGIFTAPILANKVIRSISVHPKHEHLLYAGLKGTEAGDAKVMMSMDYGNSWTYLNKGKALSALAHDVQTIEASPHDEKTIYTGTWKHGLYRSLDGGMSFTKVDNFPSSDIRSILYHPEDKDHIIIATTTHGVVATKDGGANWKSQSDEYLKEHFKLTWKLEQSPYNPLEIYALTMRNGLFRSMDFGQTWSKVDGTAERMYFALGWEDASKIYCSSTNREYHFLHHSTDGGKTFTDIENTTEDLMYSIKSHNGKVYLGGQQSLYELKNGQIENSTATIPFPTTAHLLKTAKGLVVASWGNGIAILQ